MHLYVEFLGFMFPTYALCAMLGILAASFILITVLYSRRLVRKCALLAYIALPGVIFGGKLFSVISMTLMELYSGKSINLVENIKQSGNVYYGGLFGYLALLCLLCKLVNCDFSGLENPIAISIPLFHSFGRVGCFFAGCCYGIESNSWFAIAYRVGEETEVTRRVPVQLIEAEFEFCLSGLLYILFWRIQKQKMKNLCFLEIYLFAYALFRFMIEFLRGDMIRGVYGFLSFSQIVSLILILKIVCHHFYYIHTKK